MTCPLATSNLASRVAATLTAGAILTASACGQAPRPDNAPRASGTTASPNPQPASQLSRLAQLSGCDSITPPDSSDAADPDPELDCVLKSSDRLKLTFEVLGSPPETIKTFDVQGHQQQAITQKVEQPQHELPILADIDKDGRDELLVVTSAGGSGGMDIEVWHATGDSTQFKDAGSVFGFPKFWKTQQGFFANYSHDSATSGTVTVYRFDQDKLATVATLDVEAKIDPTNQKVTDVSCTLADTSGLASARIDPATAEKKLCSEPWISTIYNN